MSNRWWIYQKERFPIFQNGLLSLLLGASAVGYSLLLRRPADLLLTPAVVGAMVLAGLTTVLFLMQQQVIDEFKSFPVDGVQHPNRPVPRSLVRLQSLQLWALAAGLVQFGLALPHGFWMVLLLAGVWSLLLVLSGWLPRTFRFKSAKLPNWVYRLGRCLSWTGFALYATAQDWLAANLQPPVAIGWFLLVSFGVGLVFELSRNLTVGPQMARIRPAILRWLLGVWLLTLAALVAGAAIQWVVPVTVVALGLLLLSSLVAVRVWRSPSASTLNALKLITALWPVGVYFNLGILPLVMNSPL